MSNVAGRAGRRGGRSDDRRRRERGIRLHTLKDLEAVQARHQHIEKDEVWAGGVEQLQRGIAVFGLEGRGP
jgi:hypothetical protein